MPGLFDTWLHQAVADATEQFNRILTDPASIRQIPARQRTKVIASIEELGPISERSFPTALQRRDYLLERVFDVLRLATEDQESMTRARLDVLMSALAQALAERGEAVPGPLSRAMLVDWSTALHDRRLVLAAALQVVELILSRIEEAELAGQPASAVALLSELPEAGSGTEMGQETAQLLVELLEEAPQGSWRPTTTQARDALAAAHESVVVQLRLLGTRGEPHDLFEQVDMVAYLLRAYSARQGAEWAAGSPNLPEALPRSLAELAGVLETGAQIS